MQLLSALDQITEPLWAALYVSVALVAIGVVTQAAAALLPRLCTGAFGNYLLDAPRRSNPR